MMRSHMTSGKALAITELMAALTITAVISIVGWATWEMGRRETAVTMARTATSRTAFSCLERIEQEVMRASAIEVPDPDHPNVDSIQLWVPVSGSTVRRAFRLEGDALIIDLKDEGVAPYAAFEGVLSLGFTILDSPANSQVQISCTCIVNGHTVQMQTVAKKRN